MPCPGSPQLWQNPPAAHGRVPICARTIGRESSVRNSPRIKGKRVIPDSLLMLAQVIMDIAKHDEGHVIVRPIEKDLVEKGERLAVILRPATPAKPCRRGCRPARQACPSEYPPQESRPQSSRAQTWHPRRPHPSRPDASPSEIQDTPEAGARNRNTGWHLSSSSIMRSNSSLTFSGMFPCSA